MAAMSAKGPSRDGSISKSVHDILVYLCSKFGAFMTKCTIGLVLWANLAHCTDIADFAESQLYVMVLIMVYGIFLGLKHLYVRCCSPM